MIYKLSEKFKSLQGEGTWVGTPMAFVRLAQCPVGGRSGVCTSALNRQFVCDTGPQYRGKGISTPYTTVTERLNEDSILSWVLNYKHVCITGGEPFVYDLEPLVTILVNADCWVHIETSGVIPPPDWLGEVIGSNRVWITLSPKLNWSPLWVPRADELKLLVDKATTTNQLLNFELEHFPFGFPHTRTFLQPIEEINMVSVDHLQHLALTTNTRVSVQLHKLLEIQ